MSKFMFTFLPKTLTLVCHRHFSPQFPIPSSRLYILRTQSSHSSSHHDNCLSDLTDFSDSALPSSSDPPLCKFEDAIHQIVVRRLAPDWLPFLPGASYWVPLPRSQIHGIAHLLDKFANPLTEGESLYTTTCGWPSSQHFIQGEYPHPVEVEKTSTERDASQSEDEEG